MTQENIEFFKLNADIINERQDKSCIGIIDCLHCPLFIYYVDIKVCDYKKFPEMWNEFITNYPEALL